MRTEALIAALAAEGPPAAGSGALRPRALRRRLLWSAALGLMIAAPVAMGVFGPRPGLLGALADPGVALKFAAAGAGALAGLWLLLRAAEPGRALRPLGAGAPAAALALAVALLWPDPRAADWVPTVDSASVTCLFAVSGLALAALGLFLAALRRGAPTRPALAGAAAGLAAGGLGAAAYAIHCPIDAPGYVATWYPAGMLAATGIGALIGRRSLVW